METSIIPQDDGYLASSDEKSIFFPNAELLNVGCKNCIWKLHNQCPYGLKDDEIIEFSEFEESGKESTKTFKIYPNHNAREVNPEMVNNRGEEPPSGFLSSGGIYGICPDMIQFLLTFADKSNSLTAIWEKFYNYKIRLQESIDYRDYIELNKKIREMESDLKSAGWSEKQIEEMQRLKSDRMAAKIWWAKLHQYASFTMQKIVDRETKQNEMPRLAGIHSSGTINFNIKQEAKQIEEK